MQQGSILPFLQKSKPSRPENSRPGQPYRSRPYSERNSQPKSASQHRGPNRRRNMDLKKIADETKAELPKILAGLSGFNAAESSVHSLSDLGALDPNDCPGFVLPHDDVDAGKKGTRIRVIDMDSFDAALQLNPDYKVHVHLGISKPLVANNDSSDELRDDDLTSCRSKNDHVVEGDSDLFHGDTNQAEANLGTEGKTEHQDSDIIMDDTENLSTPAIETKDGTDTAQRDDRSIRPGDRQHNAHSTTFKGRTPAPVAVLNLASERSPGGGWQNGALAQEECLCYRSSLYLSLHKAYYPLPSLSAIYTPNVVLIREAMSRGHALLTPHERPANLPVTSVISVAALRKPQLTDDGKSFRNPGQHDATKSKIRATLRIAAANGHTKLVLGALGCGVFANPPKDVAECFLAVLRETEFQGGWWDGIAFAVLDNVKGPHGGEDGDGDGNFGVFYRVLHGQVV